MTGHDDHLPAPDQGPCECCHEMGHLYCMPAGLERDVGPLIAIADACRRVERDAA